VTITMSSPSSMVVVLWKRWWHQHTIAFFFISSPFGLVH
jgi:hypothetical protein